MNRLLVIVFAINLVGCKTAGKSDDGGNLASANAKDVFPEGTSSFEANANETQINLDLEQPSCDNSGTSLTCSEMQVGKIVAVTAYGKVPLRTNFKNAQTMCQINRMRLMSFDELVSNIPNMKNTTTQFKEKGCLWSASEAAPDWNAPAGARAMWSLDGIIDSSGNRTSGPGWAIPNFKCGAVCIRLPTDSPESVGDETDANGKRIPYLPEKFVLKEHLVSLTTTFSLKTEDDFVFGSMAKHFFAIRTVYSLYDTDNKTVLATAKKALLSWGVEINVYDSQDRLIGTIKENIFKSLFKVSTSYQILDSKGKEVATSEKAEWLTPEFTIKASSGRDVLNMRRRIVTLSDTYDVNYSSDKTVDRRILLFIAAYKTDADNERKSAK